MYTIKDLSEGKVSVKNDGTLEELRKVLKIAFPKEQFAAAGNTKYYSHASDEKWQGSYTTDLPTQSVKDFLKQVKEEKPLPRMAMVRYSEEEDWSKRELLADLSEYSELEYKYVCRDRGYPESVHVWKYMKEVEEEFYKIGDKFEICEKEYLLSLIGVNKVALINKSGESWSFSHKIGSILKITSEEMESIVNVKTLSRKYDWKKIN